MNTNQYFSFSRIARVMKRDLMENWKTNFYRSLGIYAFFTILIGFTMHSAEKMLTYRDLPEIQFEYLCKQLTAAFFTIVIVVGMAYASFVGEVMKIKEQRISYLMLPATMLEKFVARTLFVTLGFVMMVVCCLLLAEVTRYLILPLFDLPDCFRQSTFPYVFDSLYDWLTVGGNTTSNAWPYETTYSLILAKWDILLLLVWLHSFFILGGCYWYNKPFWKTLGVMILVNIAGVYLLVQTIELLAENDWDFEQWLEAHFNWVTLDGLLSFCFVLEVVLVMLNWWLSYRQFSRSQVVKPKFRLL